MPRRDSKPEIAVRKALHAAGVRFRVNDRRLPGRPDIALTRARIAVFVDGCFWHACPQHGVLPKNNRAWWREKLDGNVERDRRKDSELVEQGWTPLRYWEHESVEVVAAEIEQLWRERTGRIA